MTTGRINQVAALAKRDALRRPLPAPSRAQRVLVVQGGKLKNLRRVRWVRARSPERTPIKPETRFRRSPPVGLLEVTSQRFERRAGPGR